MVKTIDAKMNNRKVDLIQENRNDSFTVDKIDSINNKTDSIVTIAFPRKYVIAILVSILLILFWSKLLPVITIMFFAFVLASGFLPIVNWLQIKKIKKNWAIVISYVSFLILASIIISLVVVPFFGEFDNLINSLPSFSSKIASVIDSTKSLNLPFFSVDSSQIKTTIENTLHNFTSDIMPVLTNGFDGIKTAINTIADLAGGLVTVVTSIILSIYIISDHDYLIDTFLQRFVDYRKSDRVRKLLSDVEARLGNWIVGQMILSLLIGFLAWVMLTILGIPFALPLAVLAALLESIPNIGPFIAAIPGILFAFIDGGATTALYVTFGYVIIQQLEGVLIVPRVMGNAVGLRSIYVLVGIMVGFAIGNILGALVAVPIMVILKIGLEFYFDLQRLKAVDKI